MLSMYTHLFHTFFYDVFENALRSQLIKQIRPTDEAISLFIHVDKDWFRIFNENFHFNCTSTICTKLAFIIERKHLVKIWFLRKTNT